MKNNNFNFTFLNKYYVNQKENELKKLEDKKEELTKAIEEENVKKNTSLAQLSKLKNESKYLCEQFDNLKKAIIKNGSSLIFENMNFNLKEWDNLVLHKRNSAFILQSKSGEELYLLEKKYTAIIEEVLKEGYDYSLVIIRVTSRIIKCQLRFIKKETL